MSASPPPSEGPRLDAVDAARGAALAGMFVFHFVWDLGFFGYVSPGLPYSPGFMAFGHVIAASFLLLVGVSLALAARKGFHPPRFWKRIGIVAAAAALVSAATYAAFPDRFVFFGILHCILAGSLLGGALLRAPLWLVAAAAAAILAAPFFIAHPVFDAPALWWVGLGLTEPPTNDWRPFFPWACFVLAGLAAARAAIMRDRIDLAAAWRGPRMLVLAGRHSLLIYLVHQPVFLALIWASTLVTGSPEEANYRRACKTQCARPGNEANFCARACACVATRLKQEGLWRPVLSNSLSPAQNETFTGIGRICAIEAAGAGG